jgi:ABC-2 type transport system permease protein
MPVAQILIFGFVITTEINNAKIAILDKSKDEVTRNLTNRILSSGYFIAGKILHSESEIKEAFTADRVKMVIVYEPDFAQKLDKDGSAHVQLIADASDANTARLLTTYCEGIFGSFQMEMNIQSGAIKKMIVPEVRMMYNENLDGVYMSVPGIMAMILMLISAMMTSVSIAREKEYGSMEVLLISPLKPIQIIIGKVTPYVLLSLINAVTIIALGYFVFGVPIKGSIMLLMFVNLVFIILALSLGILISTISDNQMSAMFMSLFALMLPTILLSGFIFPIENMPMALQWFSAIMPPRWFIVIIKDIMLKGVGITYFWKELLILFAFIAFFIGMSVKKFNIRLQ